MARHRLFNAKRSNKWHLRIHPDGSRSYIAPVRYTITYRDGYPYILGPQWNETYTGHGGGTMATDGQQAKWVDP